MEPGFETALGAAYRLVATIGRGAAGEVWTAIDTRTGETVAAKLLRPEHVTDPDLVARFIAERSLLLGLRHPGIVAVRDLVVEGDRLAIIMDYLSGGSLRDQLRARKNLPPSQATAVTVLLLDALAHAHAQGVLHRDVKPDNLVLSENWPELIPGSIRLTDFGIARLIGERQRATTGLLGTPNYMAPELILTGECDEAADVYGAGILLYELVAGRPPFAGPGTDFTIAHRHVSAAPVPLAIPELWPSLKALLDKDPAARPSAPEAAALFRQALPGLDDLPAIDPLAHPEQIEEVSSPHATVVRGAGSWAARVRDHTTDLGPAADLGEATSATMVRPMPVVPAAAVRPTTGTPSTESSEPRPWWRNWKPIAAATAALVLVGGASIWAVTSRIAPTAADPNAAAPVSAVQQDAPLPTGLSVTRSAQVDPGSEVVRLTITFGTQNAQLSGPFLEVLPGPEGAADCPIVTWQDDTGRRNLATTTGITTACAWSVDPGVIAPQSTLSVSAEVVLGLDSDPEALQAWLDDAAGQTASSLRDPELTSAAYPVQRLQGITVSTPPELVAGSTLTVSLIPQWPSGEGSASPLYKSPSVGAPTATLVAIAGGEEGVRFSDGCSGALKVSADGLTVTALNISTDCTLNAQVGNFTNLTSSPFSIVTRGG